MIQKPEVLEFVGGENKFLKDICNITNNSRRPTKTEDLKEYLLIIGYCSSVFYLAEKIIGLNKDILNQLLSLVDILKVEGSSLLECLFSIRNLTQWTENLKMIDNMDNLKAIVILDIEIEENR